MPIIVHYGNNMRPDVVNGESWKQLDQATAKSGMIYLTDLGDGHRIIVNKAAWVRVDEIPQEKWDANVEAQKKQQQDQLKSQAETKARAAAATLALLEAKTFRGRVKRLLGRKP
jgi:hypothetical protein